MDARITDGAARTNGRRPGHVDMITDGERPAADPSADPPTHRVAVVPRPRAADGAGAGGAVPQTVSRTASPRTRPGSRSWRRGPARRSPGGPRPIRAHDRRAASACPQAAARLLRRAGPHPGRRPTVPPRGSRRFRHFAVRVQPPASTTRRPRREGRGGPTTPPGPATTRIPVVPPPRPAPPRPRPAPCDPAPPRPAPARPAPACSDPAGPVPARPGLAARTERRDAARPGPQRSPRPGERVRDIGDPRRRPAPAVESDPGRPRDHPGPGRRSVPAAPQQPAVDPATARVPLVAATPETTATDPATARVPVVAVNPAGDGVTEQVPAVPARQRFAAPVSRFDPSLFDAATMRVPHVSAPARSPAPPCRRCTSAARRRRSGPCATFSRRPPAPTPAPRRSTTATGCSTTPRCCARSTPSAPCSAPPASATATGSGSASRRAPPTCTSRSSRRCRSARPTSPSTRTTPTSAPTWCSARRGSAP